MNTRTGWLVGALGVALLLLLLSRTRKGEQVVATVTDSLASAVIGLRLNNPLNVERGQDWQGLAADQPNARFAKFIDKPHGIRAWHKIMQTYSKSYGIRTVRGIVDRYNPKADGQPEGYGPSVALEVGVNESTSIDVMNPALAFKLCRAMMRIELGGVAASLVFDDDVAEGLRLAGVAI